MLMSNLGAELNGAGTQAALLSHEIRVIVVADVFRRYGRQQSMQSAAVLYG